MSRSNIILINQFVFLSTIITTTLVDASVQVVDLNRVYQSRPDKYVGLQMRTGLEYPARLQMIRDNLHLCGSTEHNITIPTKDGLPGMLYFLFLIKYI
jgi:hypothetical protein